MGSVKHGKGLGSSASVVGSVGIGGDAAGLSLVWRGLGKPAEIGLSTVTVRMSTGSICGRK